MSLDRIAIFNFYEESTNTEDIRDLFIKSKVSLGLFVGDFTRHKERNIKHDYNIIDKIGFYKILDKFSSDPMSFISGYKRYMHALVGRSDFKYDVLVKGFTKNPRFIQLDLQLSTHLWKERNFERILEGKDQTSKEILIVSFILDFLKELKLDNEK